MENQRFQKVMVSEHETACGNRFGQLTLNKASSLNALDLDMAIIMRDTLAGWQRRDDILFVVIDSVGSKAFCAGGDIVSMYNAMEKQQRGIPKFIEQFFTMEYELDYMLHIFPIPIVVWGQGIVMGGGLGIFEGASHRVALQNTVIAMPEITIGLFPDVGGSYFLPRLPANTGLFLGLTAAQLNAVEAQSLGLADFVCAAQSIQPLLRQWQDMAWSGDISQMLSETLEEQEHNGTLENRLQPWLGDIEQACNVNSVVEIAENILAIDAALVVGCPELQATLTTGSPLTANLFYQQYKKGKDLPLNACFRMELDLACRSAEYGEFQEGVRALLIDKDKKPQWRFQKIKDVPDTVLAHFFSSPWSRTTHPLAHLN